MLANIRSQGVMPITWNPQQKMGVVDVGDFSEAIANVLADPQPHIDANKQPRSKLRGIEPSEIEIMRRMCSFYDQHGLPNGNSKVLEHLLTRPSRSYRQFVEETFKSTGDL